MLVPKTHQYLFLSKEWRHVRASLLIKLANTTGKEPNMPYGQSILKLMGMKDKKDFFQRLCTRKTSPWSSPGKKSSMPRYKLQVSPYVRDVRVRPSLEAFQDAHSTNLCSATLLHLKKARYQCKSCGYTHTLETSPVAKHCLISRATRESIMTLPGDHPRENRRKVNRCLTLHGVQGP